MRRDAMHSGYYLWRKYLNNANEIYEGAINTKILFHSSNNGARRSILVKNNGHAGPICEK